jgi:hypothetical protein
MSDAGGMKIRTLAVEDMSFHTSASAGSPSERVRITSDGNVSIGTSTALGKLHVHEGTRNGSYAISSGHDAFVIEGTQHVGLSIAGGSDNSGSAGIAFPNGSSSIDGLIQYEHVARSLQFHVGGSERARFEANGDFLLGMTTSGFTGGVGCELNISGYVLADRDGGASGFFNRRSSDGTLLAFYRQQNAVGSVSVTTSGTTYNTTSDRRLKSNIQDCASASSKIDAIQVRQFDWNESGDHQDYGLIAQELQPIEPTAVSGSADSDEMMGVDYSRLVPMLIKEIQELRGRVAALEAS